MKHSIMKKWVKALRSGKFKQGQGTLKQFNNNGQAQHCCLGVLCELYNSEMKKNHKKTLPVKVLDNNADYLSGLTRFGNKTDDLPTDVKKWAGMRSGEGKFKDENDSLDSLMDMNDSGKTFKTIANVIEDRWEIL